MLGGKSRFPLRAPANPRLARATGFSGLPRQLRSGGLDDFGCGRARVILLD